MNNQINYKYQLKTLKLYCFITSILAFLIIISLTKLSDPTKSEILPISPITCIIALLLLWQRCGFTLCKVTPWRNVAHQISTSVKQLSCVFVGSITLHFLAVLMGAPVFDKTFETFQFSFLVTVCGIFPSLCCLGLNKKAWSQVHFLHKYNDELEFLSGTLAMTTIIGAWLGAFVIPLDWDRPWQIWPRSCVISSIAGYFLGLIISTVRLHFRKTKL